MLPGMNAGTSTRTVALAQANRDPFPADLVATVIDERTPAKGHGGGDMPVWGAW